MADILVIEDDLALRGEIERFLEGDGHCVVVEADGAQALSLLKSTGFDVVVLDIKLGGMSGIDVLKHLHSDLPVFPPVIIMTGHGDKNTAISALHFGAFEFLEKPFHPNTLKLAIGRALSEKKEDAL